jgi:3-oxoacyl-ACP reductase-like protein
MRQFTCALALALLAGCASQPSTSTPAPAPVAAAAPAAAPVAGTATAKAAYPGYKEKTYKGETVYCKKVAKIGSRFEDETCMTGPEMERMMQQAETDKDQFRRNQTICGTSGCGGS